MISFIIYARTRKYARRKEIADTRRTWHLTV